MLAKLPFKKHAIKGFFLGEQVLFSGANFLLMIMLARFYSDVEVSAYGIALSASLMIQGVLRNCYMVQNSVLLPDIIRNRGTKLMGQHLIFWGIIIALELLALLASVIFDLGYRLEAILSATIVTSLIYGHLSFDRIVMIKYEKYLTPMFAAFVFASIIGTLFLVNWFVTPVSFFVLMLCLALFAAGKITYSVLSIGAPDFFWGWRLARKNARRFLAASTSGSLGYTGYNHIPLFILGTLPSATPAAVFTAMRGLTQPLQLVVRSMDIVDKNFFQTKGTMTEWDIRAKMLRQLGLYAAMSSVFVLGAVILGEWIIYIAYGEKYAHASDVLIGFAVWVMLLTVSFPIETVIVKKDRLNKYNYFRLLAGATGTIAALILCEPYGALGCIIACILGSTVSLAISVWILRDIFFMKPDQNKPQEKASAE